MFFAALLMLVALAITSVAGYFSILGLMAIFPASPVAIAAMGIVLELAKLVTASWVYRNWKIANKLLKTYFTIAVVVLSFITSMGVFGYLSKAHIEHTTVGGSAQLQIAQLESQKTSAERRLKNAQTSLDTLDHSLLARTSSMLISLEIDKRGNVRPLIRKLRLRLQTFRLLRLISYRSKQRTSYSKRK